MSEERAYLRSGLSPLEWEFLTRLAWTAGPSASIALLSDGTCPVWMFDAALALERGGLVERDVRVPRPNPVYAVTSAGWAALGGRPRAKAPRRAARALVGGRA